ncbi:MFS transporter [Paracoccus sp. P2]|uniref:MFS transporter n=1 Tax=Paracoccus sp. P2 TaxID=3248840 RepID=UPI00391FCA5E
MIHEWACQPYFSLIVIFLFAPYFVSHVAADPVAGQALWSYAHAIAGLAIALLGPFMGAVADAGGPRKPWILGCTLVAGSGCIALWWATPGAPPHAVLAAVVMGAVGIECLFVFANAMLPSIASSARIGLVSGFGIAMGQLAGILALVLILLAVALPGTVDAAFGPASPLFGLSAEHFETDRIVGPVAGLWLILFMLPFFFFVPDRAPRGIGRREVVREGFRRLRSSLAETRRVDSVLVFLAARVVFYSGMNIVFLFGGVLAATIYAWGTAELTIYGLLATSFAVAGAVFGGLFDRRFGARATLTAALLMGAVAFLVMLSCERERVLLIVPLPLPDDAAMLGTATEWAFLSAAAIFGLAAGAVMASSRTLFARIAPPDRLAEFFGIYALSAQAAAFIGPVLVGLITAASSNQKSGLLVAVPLITCGALLLLRVRERAMDGAPGDRSIV